MLKVKAPASKFSKKTTWTTFTEFHWESEASDHQHMIIELQTAAQLNPVRLYTSNKEIDENDILSVMNGVKWSGAIGSLILTPALIFLYNLL